jgi:hypothetical protein
MHRMKNKSNFKFLSTGVVLVVLLLTGLNTGCSGTEKTTEIHIYYEIDPLFREIYLFLGGPEVLGLAISPAKGFGNITAQYMETCKMVYDPDAPLIQRFYLASLGKDLGFFEPAVPTPSEPDVVYVDGHSIFSDFLPLYEKLGARMVGKPLTEGYHNLIRNRYEQHFENVGFFRMDGSPDVHLLAYGVMACGEDCTSSNPGNATIDINNYIDPTFQEFVNNQGADFTGYALSDAYVNEEGTWEQILENVVLAAESADSPQSVRLQPLAEKLSLKSSPPGLKSNNPDMYFYPTQGDLGYEIPSYFFDYLNRHGGLAFTGLPIAQVSSLGDKMKHQCFTNLCLAYDPVSNEGGRVRPEPLGYAYKYLYYKETFQPTPTPEPAVLDGWPTPQGQPVLSDPVSPDQPVEDLPPEQMQPPIEPAAGEAPGAEERTVTFRSWESFPVLGSGRIQEVGIEAKSNGQPMGGLPLELTVTMPDGNQLFYIMPETNANGKSTLSLPPFDAPNGTIVPYLVCVRLENRQKICLEKSFIIWSLP